MRSGGFTLLVSRLIAHIRPISNVNRSVTATKKQNVVETFCVISQQFLVHKMRQGKGEKKSFVLMWNIF